MGEFLARDDDPLILSLKVYDRSPSKVVRAYLTDQNENPLPGSPFTLSHTTHGKYKYMSPTLKFPTGADQVEASYLVWDNVVDSADLTKTAKCHTDGYDVWQRFDPSDIGGIGDKLDEILDKVCQILNTISSLNQGTELVACIDSIEICGIVEVDEITGTVEVIELCGFVEVDDELFAWVGMECELVGVVEDEDG